MKIILTIILICFLSSTCYADEFVAKFIKKNEVASFDGYILPESMVLQILKSDMERDLFKIELDKTYKKIELLETQNEWTKYLYFFAGVGVVLISAYALNLSFNK